jgi:hypothetical protein
MHEQKLDGPVQVGRCDFIFEKTTKWDDFIRDKPLAFCIGFHRDRLEKVKEKLKSVPGFDILKIRETREAHQAIFAINEKFRGVLSI